jgi:hypothetical protein
MVLFLLDGACDHGRERCPVAAVWQVCECHERRAAAGILGRELLGMCLGVHHEAGDAADFGLREQFLVIHLRIGFQLKI